MLSDAAWLFKDIQEYLQNKMYFTKPGWNHEYVRKISKIECLAHIKCDGNSKTFLSSNEISKRTIMLIYN